MVVMINQHPNVRRQAAALLGWLREGDPTAGLAQLAEVVLADWIVHLGGTLPVLPERAKSGRKPILDPYEVLSRKRIDLPGGWRARHLMARAIEVSGAATPSEAWRRAVERCYQSITAPVTAEDLGPQTGAWVAQGPQGPFEAAA
jgi:hypothetical protein